MKVPELFGVFFHAWLARQNSDINSVVQRDRTTKTDDGDTDFSCIINQWLVMKAEKPRIDVYSSYHNVQTYSNISCRFFSSHYSVEIRSSLYFLFVLLTTFSDNARALYVEIVADKIHGHEFSIQLYIRFVCESGHERFILSELIWFKIHDCMWVVFKYVQAFQNAIRLQCTWCIFDRN